MFRQLAATLLLLSLPSLFDLTKDVRLTHGANAACAAEADDRDMFEQSNTTSRPTRPSDLPSDPNVPNAGPDTAATAVEPAPEVVPEEVPAPKVEPAPVPAQNIAAPAASPPPALRAEAPQASRPPAPVTQARETAANQPRAIAERLAPAEQSEHETKSTQRRKGIIPFSAGAIVSAPVSMYRKSKNELRDGVQSITKGSSNPCVTVPATLISLPFCTAAGVAEGAAFAAKHGRACSSTGD